MSNIFRVFVSSTFSDMVAERNALQEDVFPRLRDWCRKQGVTFQAIDLRWGISQEAGLNQRATDVCLNEIARCQKSTKRPNFLLLMGDRYGWRPLPDDIPASEWDAFYPHITNPDDKNLLHLWYKRDDNAVPPLYVLQKRTGKFADPKDKKKLWAGVENQLQTILRTAISGLNWDDRTRMKYETSVTEQEIQAGIFDYTYADEGAICFFRTIHDLPDDMTAKDYRDMKNGVPDTHAQARLTALKNRIRAHIPNGVHEYDATWRKDKPDIDLKAFCDRVYAVLQGAIEAEIATQQNLTPQQIEQNAHDAFRDERGRLVIGRDDVLNRVGEYIRSDNSSALVLHGQSGVGKSSIMARAIPDDAIYRFIGVTPQSSDIRQVVYGLCEHIAIRYGISETIPQDYDELIESFPKFLASATADKPLILFLDALDQLSDANAPHNLRWLPKELPAHVKLVVSVIPSKYLTVLQRQPPAENLVEIPPLAQSDADTLLDKWLSEVHRTVQPHQRHEIMTKFAHTGLPLYLKLAFEEAKLWRSYDKITKRRKLGSDVLSLIRDNLFKRLSHNAEHGALLVNRSMAYLRASRNGLTEDEILELLTADKTYWDDFYAKSFHKEALDVIGGVPIVIWSRLYFDLAPYMTQRSADGTALWAFFHRQFNEVVDATYLSEDVRQDRHAHLADYFMRQKLYLGNIPNTRKVSEQAYQQAMAGMKDAYVATLMDYPFLEMSVNVRGVQAVIEDCGLMPDETVQLIQSALSMSAHILIHNPDGLIQQLVGRLMMYRKTDIRVMSFIDAIPIPQGSLYPIDINGDYLFLNPAGGMLIRTLEGHVDDVTGAIVLPDGRFLSWSGGQETKEYILCLWDNLGNSLKTLKGHTKNIQGALGLSDGRFLTWSADKTVRFWDSDGYPLAILPAVNGALPLSDGRFLSWSADTTLRLWDADGNPLKVLEGHTKNVNGVLPLSDGRFLSWSADTTLRLWDADGNPLKALEGHTKNVNGVLPLSDGRFLSWGADNMVCFWGSDGHPLHILESYPKDIKSVNALSNNQFLLREGENQHFLDKDGNLIRTLEGKNYRGGVIVLDDKRFLSWSGKLLRLWDGSGNLLRILEGHSRNINGVIALEDGRFLSWGRDRTLILWSMGGKALTSIKEHIEEVWCLTPLNDGRVLSGGADGGIGVWDKTGKLIRVFKMHSDAINGVAQLADGRFMSWGWDNKTRLWTINGEQLNVLEGHSGVVMGTQTLDDGRFLSWSNDNTLCLWDADGTLLKILKQHFYPINGVHVLDDGRFLSWSFDATLCLWTNNGELIRVLEGHSDEIHGICILKNGRFLSWSEDRTLILWDNEGHLLQALEGHPGAVYGALELEDGRLLSWDNDNTISLWDADGKEIDWINENYSWRFPEHSENIFKWAEKHRFDGMKLFYDDPPIGDIFRISKRRDTLLVYEPKTGKVIHRFYGDAFFTAQPLIVLDRKVVVVGDAFGRVIFLRWVELEKDHGAIHEGE